jgi:hypothetical protein
VFLRILNMCCKLQNWLHFRNTDTPELWAVLRSVTTLTVTAAFSAPANSAAAGGRGVLGYYRMRGVGALSSAGGTRAQSEQQRF